MYQYEPTEMYKKPIDSEEQWKKYENYSHFLLKYITFFPPHVLAEKISQLVKRN